MPTVNPGATITIYGHWYTSTCNDTGGAEPLKPLPPVHLTLTLPGGDVHDLGEFDPVGPDRGFSTEVHVPATSRAGTATVSDDQEPPVMDEFEIGQQPDHTFASSIRACCSSRVSILRDDAEPDLRTHEGHDWAFVLNGKLRLVLAEHDLILEPGEAAEFDTRTPHWFGATSSGPVEFLSLVRKQGERAHVRTTRKQPGSS